MSLKRAIQLTKSFIAHPILFTRAYLLPSSIPQGKLRWREKTSLRSAWDDRTQMIARMIPSGASVLEFGAGRRVLEKMLPPGCTYQPSDIVERGPDTLVCDLNEGLPTLDGRFSVVVFSGVLEYVLEPAPLIRQLADHCETVIASYASLEECPDPLTRRVNGWVNSYSQDDFTKLFENAGFCLTDRQAWEAQTIYAFTRVR